jgi:hypothetical protein
MDDALPGLGCQRGRGGAVRKSEGGARHWDFGDLDDWGRIVRWSTKSNDTVKERKHR